MISRRAKAAFFASLGPLMQLNGWFYRTFRAPRTGTVRAHLGPGQVNYIDGWINIDANAFTARCDVWADLRNPIPLRSGTAQAVYSHHVIEHLPNLRAHLQDVHRVLAPGGVYRLAGPDGDSAIRKFTERDAGWFGDFPDRRRSVGGRFENFVFCRGEHLTILLQDFLRELLEGAGFAEVATHRAGASTGFPGLFEDVLAYEHEPDPLCPHHLVLEARKADVSIPD